MTPKEAMEELRRRQAKRIAQLASTITGKSVSFEMNGNSCRIGIPGHFFKVEPRPLHAEHPEAWIVPVLECIASAMGRPLPMDVFHESILAAEFNLEDLIQADFRELRKQTRSASEVADSQCPQCRGFNGHKMDCSRNPAGSYRFSAVEESPDDDTDLDRRLERLGEPRDDREFFSEATDEDAEKMAAAVFGEAVKDGVLPWP